MEDKKKVKKRKSGLPTHMGLIFRRGILAFQGRFSLRFGFLRQNPQHPAGNPRAVIRKQDGTGAVGFCHGRNDMDRTALRIVPDAVADQVFKDTGD